jgi:hypothetical protein
VQTEPAAAPDTPKPPVEAAAVPAAVETATGGAIPQSPEETAAAAAPSETAVPDANKPDAPAVPPEADPVATLRKRWGVPLDVESATDIYESCVAKQMPESKLTKLQGYLNLCQRVVRDFSGGVTSVFRAGEQAADAKLRSIPYCSRTCPLEVREFRAA